ncbi:unnamed protein product [Notodromas monacha]|uniref:18S rRNA (pseudouridine-N1)-methyltransferase n=1 Tax=Notodromas monacha TaxID=399045 RepID=A0A7R9GL29_9CRUS|nr:unnamed protein product [Notodromas monacha]CAG0924495.1 unnamed protein product [Notodromas monacha]
MGRKRKQDDDDPSQIDLPPRHLQTPHARSQRKRLVVVLENSLMESIRVGGGFELLNADDHTSELKKLGRTAGSARPDITHQCLLMLMDSPLNRAGLLQVYIHTNRNVLIEVNPQTRIPRTFPRFAGLIVQLLHKLSVRSAESGDKLMKVIKNPITSHFPAGVRKVLMSFSAEKLVKARDLVPADDEPLVIVVGAMAHGKVEIDYHEDEMAISSYPLSAALTCTKLCDAFEDAWGVH